MAARFSLVGRRCLGVVGLLEGVTLRSLMVFRVARHVCSMGFVMDFDLMMVGIVDRKRKKVMLVE